MKIHVDADACPVKAEVARVAARYGLRVDFVANSRMAIPAGELFELVVVGRETSMRPTTGSPSGSPRATSSSRATFPSPPAASPGELVSSTRRAASSRPTRSAKRSPAERSPRTSARSAASRGDPPPSRSGTVPGSSSASITWSRRRALAAEPGSGRGDPTSRAPTWYRGGTRDDSGPLSGAFDFALGSLDRVVGTAGLEPAHAAPPLKELLADASEPPPVWPHPNGTARGPSLAPLFPSAPGAALEDPALYELLALFDALRAGRAREREMATRLLEERLR